MVEFSPEPRSGSEAVTLRVVRVGSDRPIKGYVTSETWVGCETHFAGGRTVPCEQKQCEVCSSGTPPRWHAYLGLILHPSGEHVLLILPTSALPSLKQYRAEFQTIRGANLIAFRPSKRPNGRVITSLDHGGRASLNLPAGPPIESILLRMWATTAGLRSAQPTRRKRNPPSDGEQPEMRVVN